MLNKGMTFFEAVAAMDAGYVVERDDDNTDEGGLVQWRKDSNSIRYFRRYRQRNRDKSWDTWMAWRCAGFESDDIHATDWRMVEEMAVDKEPDADGERDVTEMLRLLEAGHTIERSTGLQEQGVTTVQYRQVDQHYIMRYRIDDEGWADWAETGFYYDDLHATNWRVVVGANGDVEEARDERPTRDGMIEWMHQEGLDIREMEDPSGDRWHVMWGKEFVQKLAAQFPAMFRPEESS